MIDRVNFSIHRVTGTIPKLNFTLPRLIRTIRKVIFTIRRLTGTIDRINFTNRLPMSLGQSGPMARFYSTGQIVNATIILGTGF